MRPISRAVESIADPALQQRRRPNRCSIAIVLALHVLMAIALLGRRPAPPVPPAAGPRTTLVFIQIPKPKPSPAKIPRPTTSGLKLATRPSVGLPTARTLEHQLATLRKLELEPDLARAMVTDPLPNLESIDVAANTVGTGGIGRAGAGTGGTGNTADTGNLFEDCADTPNRTMVADVYRMSRGSNSISAMREHKPIKRVCLSQLDVAPRSFREGFPGMSGLIEWFGLDIRFTVNIAKATTWDLVLLSDDGAVLTIDDVEVIDNDGLHKAKPKMAQVKLAAGRRRFRVRYFQGPRQWIALQLGWKKPGEAGFNYIPRSLLARPPAM